jgi:hypothetical protein
VPYINSKFSSSSSSDILPLQDIHFSDVFKTLIVCASTTNTDDKSRRGKKSPADFPASIYHEHQWRESLIGNLLLEALKQDEEAGIQRYYPNRKVRLALPVSTSLNCQYNMLQEEEVRC